MSKLSAKEFYYSDAWDSPWFQEDPDDTFRFAEAYHAAAMAEGSEPFDPAKHLSGWVKDGDHDWSLGGCGIERLGVDAGGQLWYVWNTDSKVTEMEFVGHIPTASFFHALCGALNIK